MTLEQAGDIVDPLDGERYSYYVLSDQNNFQILTLMEEQGSLRSSVITQTYAANSDRYAMTFGKKLGILTDATNTPIQETLAGSSLDLAQTSTGYIAYLTDTESVS